MTSALQKLKSAKPNDTVFVELRGPHTPPDSAYVYVLSTENNRRIECVAQNIIHDAAKNQAINLTFCIKTDNQDYQQPVTISVSELTLSDLSS